MDFQIYASPVQQGRKKYVAVLEISDAVKLVQIIDWNELPPEQAPQRPQNRRHAVGILDYARENPETYNLPPLTLVVDNASFRPMGNHSFGRLTIPSSAKIYPIDGQHRLLALRLLARLPEFSQYSKHSISVEIFVSLSLTARQDLFVTMATTKRINKQVLMAIGQREELKIARKIANEASGFIGLIEKSRTSVPKGAAQLFTLAQIYDAYMGTAKSLLIDPEDHSINSEIEQLIFRTASLISESVPAYHLVREGDVSARETYLACDPFVLQAIFHSVFHLLKDGDREERQIRRGLSQIDWRRYIGNRINPLWETFLLPLPLAKVIRRKKHRDEISRLVTQEIEKSL